MGRGKGKVKKYWWLWSLVIIVIIIGISLIGRRAILGKRVGVIEIKGAISSARQIIDNINKCERRPDIGAIVVHIQSPGGMVVPCQEIYKALKAAKKPTVASLAAYATSGGYYIACACDRIVSNPGTITGSIGVIMSFPNVVRLMEKVGVKFNVVKSKPHKDIGSPYRDLTPEEHKLLKGVVDDVYEQFVDVVVEGRGLSREAVLEIADGRLLSGRQALEVGLVDTLGTLRDAKLLAGLLAGIPGEPKVVEFRKLRGWWVKLIPGSNEEWLKLEYR